MKSMDELLERYRVEMVRWENVREIKEARDKKLNRLSEIKKESLKIKELQPEIKGARVSVTRMHDAFERLDRIWSATRWNKDLALMVESSFMEAMDLVPNTTGFINPQHVSAAMPTRKDEHVAFAVQFGKNPSNVVSIMVGRGPSGVRACQQWIDDRVPGKKYTACTDNDKFDMIARCMFPSNIGKVTLPACNNKESLRIVTATGNNITTFITSVEKNFADALKKTVDTMKSVNDESEKLMPRK